MWRGINIESKWIKIMASFLLRRKKMRKTHNVDFGMCLLVRMELRKGKHVHLMTQDEKY